MKVKKSEKRVFGAVMSAAEKKAMDMEIQRQLAEYDRKHIREIDALVLWELREQLGFGNKRLKKFYDNFSRGIEALIRRYEMERGDDVWLCTYKLKEIGCDLEKWEKERGDRKNSEGYSDPTAYQAMMNLEIEELRFKKLLRSIKDVCDLADFEIEGRVVLIDKRSGRVWR